MTIQWTRKSMVIAAALAMALAVYLSALIYWGTFGKPEIDGALIGMTKEQILATFGKPDYDIAASIAQSPTKTGYPEGSTQEYIDKMENGTISLIYRYGDRRIIFNLRNKVMAVQHASDPYPPSP